MTLNTQLSLRDDGMSSAAALIARARQACVTHRVSFEGTDPQSLRVSSDAVEELVQSLSGGLTGQVEQIVPFAPRAPWANVFAGLFWRNLARRQSNVHIRRFYLVPSGETNRREAEQVANDDERHGLSSVPVPVAAWGAPQVPMCTLWLIANSLVVRQEVGTRGLGSWLVTRRRGEVERARELVKRLSDWTEKPVSRIKPDITAQLLESAELLHKTAQMSCAHNKILGEEGCSWYHGAWQYLRLFDMVSSPTWHSVFYLEQLRKAIHATSRPARRILISGTADYTTLAFVVEAARVEPGAPSAQIDVHVVDVCRTPLLACQWYAKQAGVKVHFHQADITEWGEFDQPFDLIVADAFLTRFNPDDAKRVVASWKDLLRPGGLVVTTVRLHPRNEYADQEAGDLEFGEDRRLTDPIDDFELRLRERAAGWQDMLSIDLESLSLAGRQYAKQMVSHDLGDADEVQKIFESQEFALMTSVPARVRGELVGTEYLRLTARRPGLTED
jgi:SAM-dependent methyltransferase